MSTLDWPGILFFSMGCVWALTPWKQGLGKRQSGEMQAGSNLGRCGGVLRQIWPLPVGLSSRFVRKPGGEGIRACGDGQAVAGGDDSEAGVRLDR